MGQIAYLNTELTREYMQRATNQDAEVTHTRLDIILKPMDAMVKIQDSAIYLTEPTDGEVFNAIETALKDNFKRIYIFTDKSWNEESDLDNGESLWNQLQANINADVRAGMIQGKFGQYIGDGFTLYFEEEF